MPRTARVADPFAALDRALGRKLVAKSMPTWLEPMLATLTDDRFSNPNWIYERKLDGYRCIAYKRGNQVRLMSRNKKPMNEDYPEIVAALKTQPAGELIIDGEITAFEEGRSTFSAIQRRKMLPRAAGTTAKRGGLQLYYYIFDILYVGGTLVTRLPLHARRDVLASAVRFADPLRLSEAVEGEGLQFYKQACKEGWEGLIAKRGDAPYTHGRSEDWLKFKCTNRQEFVIGGYTDPAGSREQFGALLVGYYEGRDLVYAGKVGTGFDRNELLMLASRMAPLVQAKNPFKKNTDELPRAAHWLSPKLVAEIEFTEWTVDGKLRHPAFQGLREDKPATRVIRECPR